MILTTKLFSTSSLCSIPYASPATSGEFSGSAVSHDPRPSSCTSSAHLPQRDIHARVPHELGHSHRVQPHTLASSYVVVLLPRPVSCLLSGFRLSCFVRPSWSSCLALHRSKELSSHLLIIHSTYYRSCILPLSPTPPSSPFPLSPSSHPIFPRSPFP